MGEEVSSIAAARAARAARKATKNGGGVKNSSKKGLIQVGIGIALFFGTIAIGYVLNSTFSHKQALMWMFGIAIGATLQRSRFCFTAAVRDPVLTGISSLAKSVLIAIAIASVGFTAIYFMMELKGAAPAFGKGAYFYVKPVGIHTAVGAFMFGIGMVIAGGCASGTLMRIGEGFFMQMFALIFFITGVMLGMFHRGFWKSIDPFNFPKIHFPDVIGWFPAVCLQIGLLLICFIVIEKIAIKTKDKNKF